MSPTFSLFPEQASTGAARVDALMGFMLVVSAVMTTLIAATILYFCVKYRRRSGSDRTPRILGSLRLELFWSGVPLLVGLAMFVWGMDVYFYLVTPPRDALEIYVVGRQWMWKVQHPGGQREINSLHVPVGRPVKLLLTSEDVIHSFFVPAFRVKADVLPVQDRYMTAWFQATKVGEFDLFCAEYCGTYHSGMIGKVIVMRPEDYELWLAEHAEGSMANEGRKVFLKYQCVTCHSGDALARAPVLEAIHGKPVPLRDGRTTVADDSYLRESILNPDAKIVAGWEPIMPSFQGQMTAEELNQVVAYLKALQPGQTPSRIDSAPPPALESRPGEQKPEQPAAKPEQQSEQPKSTAEAGEARPETVQPEPPAVEDKAIPPPVPKPEAERRDKTRPMRPERRR